jgi:hypothetical protein
MKKKEKGGLGGGGREETASGPTKAGVPMTIASGQHTIASEATNKALSYLFSTVPDT